MMPFDRFLFTMATFTLITAAILLAAAPASTWRTIGISALVGLSNVIGFIEGQHRAHRRYNPPR